MTWEMLYAKNYFVVVVVVVAVAGVISFLWYYLHELSPENFKLSLKSRFIYFKISHATINRKLIK